MDFLKRVSRSGRGLRVLCWLAQAYLRLVYRTGRWTIEGEAVPRTIREGGGVFIVAFWHGRLAMLPIGWQRLAPLHMLISAHTDGRLIAGVVHYFGLDAVAGSSTEGGSAALRVLMRWLDAGDCIGITPDGPRGPAMRASRGIVMAARLSGAPILPATYSAARRRILGSWDRMVLPLPFSRGIFLWGDPILVPKQLDKDGIESYRAMIEEKLNALTGEADRRMGHDRLTPGMTSHSTPRERQRVGGRR